MTNQNLHLSQTETEMFNEIYRIFENYKGKTRDFGFQLIHSHFHIQKDEVLHETHDVAQRTLSISPINISDISTSKATAWTFSDNGHLKVAMFCCDHR